MADSFTHSCVFFRAGVTETYVGRSYLVLDTGKVSTDTEPADGPVSSFYMTGGLSKSGHTAQ